MKKHDVLVGGGGSGGGGKAPKRTPDNLRQQDWMEALIAIGYGPIRGLAPGVHSKAENFFVGDTSLHNAGTNQTNFPDFRIKVYAGWPEDPAINFVLGGAASNLALNIPLAYQIPVVRTTSVLQRGKIDRLEIRLVFTRLVHVADDGGTTNGTARFRIEYKPARGTVWSLYNGQMESTMYGKTSAATPKDFVIEVPRLEDDDWEIRVTKLSLDNLSDTGNIDAITFESVQMVESGPKKLDSLAAVHIFARASDQFSSVPDFSGIYDGVLIPIPSNYNPETKTYDESTPWNGMWKLGYTDNPAFHTRNLIHNPVYGLVTYFLNVSSVASEFYNAGKWCDAQVPIGLTGKTRPRFTLNHVITDGQNGLELLRFIAASFNSALFDDGNGNISIRTDEVRAPRFVFTPENVSEAGFSYSDTDIATRYNDITVVFANKNLDYSEDRRKATIDNSEVVARNGLIPLEFVAVGCDNVEEAVARANYRYMTANTETTTASFRTTRIGMLLEIFDTVYVADPRTGWSSGGRLKSVLGNTLFLRDPIYFATLAQRTIRVQTFNGLRILQVVPKNLGTCYELQMVTNSLLPSEVPDRTTFTLEDTENLGLAKPFKIMSIEEVDGEQNVFDIQVVEINLNKYPDSDIGVESEEIPYSYQTPGEPVLPSELVLESGSAHVQISGDGTIVHRIYANWDKPFNAFTRNYEIDFKRRNDDTWTTVTSYDNSAYLAPVKDGEYYDIRLFAVTPLGRRGREYIERLNYRVNGKSVGLTDVLGLTRDRIASGYRYRWTPLEIADYAGVQVRQGGINNNWDTARLVARNKPDFFDLPWLPEGTNRIFFKHTDTSKNESMSPTIDTLVIAAPNTPAVGVETRNGLVNMVWPDCETSQPIQEYTLLWGTADQTPAQAAFVTSTRGLNLTVPLNDPTIRKAHLRAIDVAGNVSAWTSFTVGMEDTVDPTPPPSPTGVIATAGFATITIEHDKPTYKVGHGHKSTRIYATEVDSNTAVKPFSEAFFVGESVGLVHSIPALLGKTYRVWLKWTTNDGYDSVLPSSPVHAKVGLIGDVDLSEDIDIAARLADGSITGTKLADATIGRTKFANGIEPVSVIEGSTLPTTKSTENITMGGELYTWDGTKYSKTVKAVDVSGQLLEAQIANNAITVNKIASNAVTEAKIASNAVTVNKIANGAISLAKFASGIEPVGLPTGSTLPTVKTTNTIYFNGKTYRWDGTKYTSEVPTVDLVGTIIEGQLADNAVTVNKIASGAVEAGKLATNAVTSDKIAAKAVSLAKFADGIEPISIITAATLPTVKSTTTISWQGKTYRWNGTKYTAEVPTVDLVGTIVETQLADNAVTVAKIAANAVTLGKLAIGDFSNLVSESGFEDPTRSPWTLVTSFATIDTTKGRTGTSSLRLASGGAAVMATLPRDITVAPGEELYVELWAIKDADYNGTANNSKFRFGGPNVHYFSFEYPSSALSTTEWTKISGTLTVPANVRAMDISIRSDSTAGTVWLDDIIVRRRTSSELIAEGAVTTAKFAAGIQPVGIIAGSVIPTTKTTEVITVAGKLYRWNVNKYVADVATVDLVGTVLGTQIADNAITVTKIAAGAVQAGKIASDAVGADQIQALAITEAKVAANAITVDKVATNAITEAKLASGAVTETKLAGGAVTTAKFASGIEPVGIVAGTTVPTVKTLNVITVNGKTYRWDGTKYSASVPTVDLTGTVASAQIADNAITVAKIANGAIEEGKLAANAVTADKIAAGAVGIAKFASGLEPLGIVSGSTLPTVKTTSAILFNGKVYRWDGAKYTADVAVVDLVGQVTSAQLADNAVTVAKIAEGAVEAGKLAAGAVTADKLLDGAVGLTKFASGIEPVSNVTGSTLPTVKTTTVITMGGKVYRWDGTKYSADVPTVDLTGTISGAQLADNAVTVTKIAAGAVEAGKIANLAVGTVHLAALAVTEAKVAANAVTVDKIASGAITTAKFAAGIEPVSVISGTTVPTTKSTNAIYVNGQLYRWNGTKYTAEVSTVDLTGTIGNAQLADNAVTVAKIAAGAVDAGKLASSAVTTDKLADSAITTAKFASGIEPVTVVAGTAVPTTKSTNAITVNGVLYRWDGAKYTAEVSAVNVSGQLTDSQIAGIAAAKLTGQIVGTQITDNAITTPKIATGAITTGKIEAGAVVADSIATNAITAIKLSASAVTADKIAANAVTADKINANAVTAGKIAAGAVTATEIAAGSIVATKLAIGDYSNLVPDNDVQEFAAWTTPGDITPWSITPASGFAMRSKGRLNYAVPAGSTGYASQLESGFFSVERDAPYYVSGQALNNTEGNPFAVLVRINWHSSTGALVSYIDIGTASGTGTAPVSVNRTVVAPPTARSARLTFHVQRTGSVGSVGVGGAIVRRATTGELVVDGTITTDKLGANAVTAAKIAAGTITATEIASGAITTGKLAAGAVTANELAANSVIAVKIAAGAIEAEKIAANAITSDKISANAITSGKIAAGAISAREIATNSITAIKMAIGDFSNLVAGSDFEDSTRNPWVQNNVRAVIDPAVAHTGGSSMRMTAGGSSTMLTLGRDVSVTPGEELYVEYWAIKDADYNGQSGNSKIRFGAQPSNTQIASIHYAASALSTTEWTKRTGTIVIPAGVLYLNVTLACDSTAGTVWLDDIIVRRKSSGEMIVDGAITAEKLSALAVTADKISAGAITASKLAIGDYSNIVPDANIQDASSWTSAETFTVVVASGIDLISRGRLSYTYNATDTGNSEPIYSRDMNVEAGAQYYFSAQARAMAAGTAFEVLVRAYWYNYLGQPATGTFTDIGTLSGSGTPVRTVGLQVVPPATARYARLAYIINRSTATSGLLALGGPIVRRASSGELIVDGAITAIKVAANAVTAEKISAGAITTDKLGANAVTAAKIAALTITANELAADSITAVKLISNAVTADKIAANAVTTDKLIANAITTAKIAAGAVKADQIDAGAVTADKVSANAITSDKIAANAITAGKIAAGTITATELGANSVTTAKIAAGNVTANEIATGAITAIKIAANAIEADKIAANAVTTDKITANAITTGKIAAGAVTASEIAAGSISASKLFVGDTSNMFIDPNMVDAAVYSGIAFTLAPVAADGGPSLNEMQIVDAGSVVARPVVVEPGRNYLVSAWLETQGTGGNAVAELYARWYSDAAGTAVVGSDVLVGQNNTLAGVRVAAQLAAPATAKSVSLVFARTGTGRRAAFSAPVIRMASTGEMIVDGSITAGKLSAEAVTAGKIAAGAITTTELAAGAVTAAKIAAGTITATELAANSITTVKIAAGNVTANEIATNAITSDKILANSITTAKIAAGAVSATEIAAGSIIASKLAIGDYSNLVPDSDIQEPASWTSTDPISFVHASGYAMRSLGRVQYPVPAGSTGASAPILSGSFSVEPGSPYYITGQALGNGGSAAYGMTLRVQWFNSTGASATPATDLIGTTSGVGISPTTVEKVVTAPATARRARLAYYVDRSVSNGTVGLGGPIVRRASSGELIVDGAITADKVAASAITAGKIAAGAITTDKLDANAVTTAKLAANSVTATQILGGTITATEIASSAITAVKLAANSVESAKIAAGAITTDKLDANAVTAAKIAALTITANELAAGAITTVKLAANAVEADKIAANAVTSDKITANAITTGKIAAGAVSATEIATDAITAEKVSAGAITTDKIAANAITAGKIAANAVTAASIAAGTITATEIASGAITTAKINAGAVTANELATNSVTAIKVAANAIEAGKIAANAITTDKLNANAVTTAKIAAGAVTATEIAAGSILASKIVVTDLTNMVPNGSLDTIDAWNIPAGTAGQGFSYLPAQSSGKLGSIGAFKYTRPASPGSGYSSPIYSSRFTIEPGRPYSLSMEAAGLGEGFWHVMIRVSWLNAAGQLAPSGTPNRYQDRVLTGTGLVLNRTEWQLTSPDTEYGRFAQFELRAERTVTMTDVEFGNFVMRRAVSGELVVNGVITTDKLAATSVTAAKIAAGSIETDKLAANAVTAAKIAALTITAAEIASNAITAVKVAAGAIETDKLAANAVTADKISANAITAGKIAAGAISATEIAAGAITASKLFIGDTSNMFPDPNMVDRASYSGDSFVLSAVASDAGPSRNQLRIEGSTVARQVVSASTPVEPGKNYFFAIWSEVEASGGGNAETSIRWYSDAIGSTAITPDVFMVSRGSTTPGRAAVQLEAPANAKAVAFVFNKTAGDRRAIWSAPVIRTAASSELIVDGAITADKLAVNSVTAAKIVAGTITANELAANSVTTAKIAAGSVTATEIATGAITAIKINAGAVEADKIATNAITTDKINANAITTAKIAAGAINADQIAAKAVTVEKLTIADYSNLNLDPGMNKDAVWLARSSATAKVARAATGVLSLMPSDVGVSFPRNNASGQELRGFNISVTPGEIYSMSASVASTTLTGRPIRLMAQFVKNDGTPGGSDGSFSTSQWVEAVQLTTPSAINVWQTISGQLTVPADAAFMRLRAVVESGTSATGIWYVTNFTVRRAASAELIVDGAITANKIAANAIAVGTAAIQTGAIVNAMIGNLSADKITSGSIAAARIAAGTIDTGHLASNAVTADKIAAGQITTEKLAAGSITADKLTLGIGGNLCPDSTINQSKAFWYVDNAGLSPTVFGVTGVDGLYERTVPGSNTAALITAGTAGNDTNFAQLVSAPVAVEPGERYEVSCYFGMIRCRVSVLIAWFTWENTWITEHSSPWIDNAEQGGRLLGEYRRAGAFGVAPANASYARVFLRKGRTQPAGDGMSYMFATRPFVGRASPSQTALSNWTASGVTQLLPDGISTPSLSAMSGKFGDIEIRPTGGKDGKLSVFADNGVRVIELGRLD